MMMYKMYMNSDSMPNANPFTVNERKGASQKINEKLNSYRKDNKLGEIKWNEEVYKVCLDHSIYQANLFEINHDTFSERIAKFKAASNENVAMFFNNKEATDENIAE